MADSDSGSSRFSTLIAVLIALVSIVGAIIAWRVAVASGDAGSADTRGLLAAVDREDVTTQATITLFGHLTAYTAFVRNRSLSNAYDELAQANPTRTDYDNLSSAYDLASRRSQFFIPRVYLTRDEKLDQKRDLGEVTAQLSLNKDTTPEPHFGLADLSRNKAMWLLVNLIILGTSLLMLTSADAIQNPLRYLFLLAGLGTFGLATLAAVLIELLGPPIINIVITL